MVKLTHRQIQLAGLNILIQFDQLCKRHNLQYVLAYGTLLGAVRHKGFIPWDDDIDVCMTRPDYNRLIDECKSINNGRYQLRSFKLGNLNAPFSEYVDTLLHGESEFSKSNRYTEWGIDIFPIDGLSSDDSINRIIYKKEAVYRKLINIAESKNKGTTFLKKMMKKIIRPVCQIYGVDKLVKKIDSLANQFDFDNSNYVGVIAWGEGPQEKISKQKIINTTLLEFEGSQFPAPIGWHEYLTNIYGDYMELPPVNQRINHATIVYRNKEK